MITVCPELVMEWDREKNIDLSIEKITRGSGKWHGGSVQKVIHTK